MKSRKLIIGQQKDDQLASKDPASPLNLAGDKESGTTANNQAHLESSPIVTKFAENPYMDLKTKPSDTPNSFFSLLGTRVGSA